ncbi:hypothetical protein [Pseudomonas vranovensis]|uniref:hypothetical protein n=1 Tax=Pseudomonas vranovensis TaxID=321661 RepID=UPI003D970FC4
MHDIGARGRTTTVPGKKKLHDLLADTANYKANSHSFYLDLQAWRQFKTKFPITWNKVKFEKSTQPHIPKERGIYAFTAVWDTSLIPDHGYILYLGITGDESKSNLHTRYGQYLSEWRNASKRPKVYFMLEKWKGDLFFNFVPIPDKRLSLSKIETAFLSAIQPPINERDMSVKVTNARRAAF